MTEINTEVIEIRSNLSKEVSVEGFEAVGDIAMAQGYEDGSVEKTLMHATMGAVVSTIGNGDTLAGAMGAGAAEAARPSTKDKDEATQQWASAAVGAVASGGTGASIAKDGEQFNRQLHQREIEFLKNSDNIEAFAEYYKDYTGEAISMEDAQKILAQGGASLVDKSWNNKVGSDSRVKEARDFIKENYKDKSALFYDDKDGRRVGTNGFDASKDEYENRYANIQGFTENKDFYQQNLNIGNGSGASAGDYVDGAVQPLKDLGNALLDNPKDTLIAMGEGIIDPIGSGHETGRHIAEQEEMAQLDDMLGDDKSAATHRGNAYGGIATAIVTHGAIKGITKLVGGRVRVELDDGKTVEVPESSIVIGPNGGVGVKTGYAKNGQDIIQRESGGYYYVDTTTGNQVKINSPKDHGNVLNDTPAECYGLHCRDTGDIKKYGETTYGEDKYGVGNQQRYSIDYLEDNNVRYEQITTGTKKDMHQVQHQLIEEHKINNDGKRPDLNKNDY